MRILIPLQAQMRTLNAQVEQLRGEVATANSFALEASAALSAKEAELDESTATITTLQGEAAVATARSDGLAAELNHSHNALLESQMTCDRLHSDISHLQQTENRNVLEERIRWLEQSRNELTSTVVTFEEEKRQLATALEHERSEKMSIQTKLLLCEESQRLAVQRGSDAETAMMDARMIAADATGKLAATEAEAMLLRESGRPDRLSEYQTKCEEALRQSALAQHDEAEARAIIVSLEEHLIKSEERIVGFKRVEEDLRQKLAGETQRRELVEDAMAGLDKKYLSATKEMNELRNSLIEAEDGQKSAMAIKTGKQEESKSLHDAQHQIRELTARVQSEASAGAMLIARAERLEADLKSVSLAREQAIEREHQANIKLAGMAQRVEEYEQRFSQAQSDSQAAKQAHEQVTKILDEAKVVAMREPLVLQQLEEAKARCRDAMEEAATLRSSLASFESARIEQATLQERDSWLKSSLQGCEKRTSQLQESLDQCQRDLSKSQYESVVNQQKAMVAEESLRSVQMALKQAENERDSLQRDLMQRPPLQHAQALESAIATAEEAAIEAAARSHDSDQRVNQIATSLQAAEKELLTAKKTIQESNDLLLLEQTKRAELEGDLEALRDQIEDADSERDQIKRKLAAGEQSSESMAKQMELIEAQLADQTAEKNRLKEEARRKEEELREAREIAERAQMAQREGQLAHDKTMNRLNELSQREESFKKRLDSAVANERSQFEAELALAKASFNSLNEEMRVLRQGKATSARMEIDLSNALAQIGTLRERIKTADQHQIEIAILKERQVWLDKTLAAAEQSKADAGARLVEESNARQAGEQAAKRLELALHAAEERVRDLLSVGEQSAFQATSAVADVETLRKELSQRAPLKEMETMHASLTEAMIHKEYLTKQLEETEEDRARLEGMLEAAEGEGIRMARELDEVQHRLRESVDRKNEADDVAKSALARVEEELTEIETLKGRLRAGESASEALVAKMTESESNLKETADQLQRAEQALEDGEARAAQAEKRLSVAQSRVDALEGEKNKVKGLHERVLAELAECKSKLQGQQEKLEEANHNNETVSLDAEQAHEAASEWAEAAQQAAADRDEANAQLASVKQELYLAKQSQTAAEEELKAHRDSLMRTEDAVAVEKERADGAEKELDAARGDCQALSSEIAVLNEQCSSLDEASRKLIQLEGEREARIEQQARANGLQESLDLLKGQLSEEVSERRHASAQMTEAQRSAISLQEQLRHAESALTAAREAEHSLKRSIDEKEQMMNDALWRAEAAERGLLEAENRIHAVDGQLGEARQRMAAMQSAAERGATAELRLKELEERVIRAEKEAVEKRDIAAAEGLGRASAQAHKEELFASLANERERLFVASQRIEAIDAELRRVSELASSLREELLESKSSHSAAVADAQNARRIAEDATNAIIDAQASLGERERELAEVKRAMELNVGLLETRTKELAEANRVLEGTSARLESAQSEASRWDKERRDGLALRDALAESRGRLQRMEAALAVSREQTERSEAERLESDREARVALNALADARARADLGEHHAVRADSAEKRAKDAEARITELEISVATLSEGVARGRESERRVEGLLTQVRRLEQSLSEATERAIRGEATREAANDRQKSLEQRVHAGDIAVEAARTAASESIDALQRERADRAKAESVAKERLDALTIAQHDMQAAIHHADASEKALHREENSRKALEKELQDSVQAANALEREHDRIDGELKRAVQSSEKAETRAKQLDLELETHKRLLEEARNEANVWQLEASSARERSRRHEEAESVLSEAQKMLAEACATLESTTRGMAFKLRTEAETVRSMAAAARDEAQMQMERARRTVDATRSTRHELEESMENAKVLRRDLEERVRSAVGIVQTEVSAVNVEMAEEVDALHDALQAAVKKQVDEQKMERELADSLARLCEYEEVVKRLEQELSERGGQVAGSGGSHALAEERQRRQRAEERLSVVEAQADTLNNLATALQLELRGKELEEGKKMKHSHVEMSKSVSEMKERERLLKEELSEARHKADSLARAFAAERRDMVVPEKRLPKTEKTRERRLDLKDLAQLEEHKTKVRGEMSMMRREVERMRARTVGVRRE